MFPLTLIKLSLIQFWEFFWGGDQNGGPSLLDPGLWLAYFYTELQCRFNQARVLLGFQLLSLWSLELITSSEGRKPSDGKVHDVFSKTWLDYCEEENRPPPIAFSRKKNYKTRKASHICVWANWWIQGVAIHNFSKLWAVRGMSVKQGFNVDPLLFSQAESLEEERYGHYSNQIWDQLHSSLSQPGGHVLLTICCSSLKRFSVHHWRSFRCQNALTCFWKVPSKADVWHNITR